MSVFNRLIHSDVCPPAICTITVKLGIAVIYDVFSLPYCFHPW